MVRRAGEAHAHAHESNCQEVDYSAYWNYEIESLATTVEVGYINYQFPLLSGDASCTHELYASVGFDDSDLFGVDGGVLNPSVAYYRDVDDFIGGWIEVGVGRDFEFGKIDATKDLPGLKDTTVTPSVTLGIDNHWMDKAAGAGGGTTKMANILYCLEVSYDLSAAMSMPEKYGSVAIGGFIQFSQALRRSLLDDEFYGGAKLSYSW